MAMQPGWYPDPFSSGGYVRWWDGERWGASQTAPADAPAADLAPGAPTPPAPAPPRAAAAAVGRPVRRAPGVRGPAYGAPPGQQVAPFPLASWGAARGGADHRHRPRDADRCCRSCCGSLWPAIRASVDAAAHGRLAAQRRGAAAVPDRRARALADPHADLDGDHVPLRGAAEHALWGRTLGKRALGIRIRPLAADIAAHAGRQATIRWGTYAGGAHRRGRRSGRSSTTSGRCGTSPGARRCTTRPRRRSSCPPDRAVTRGPTLGESQRNRCRHEHGALHDDDCGSPGEPATLCRRPRDRGAFPDDFLWGTATAAYQIEGSPDADGKGPSIWDTFTPHAGQDRRRQTPATSRATTTSGCPRTSRSWPTSASTPTASRCRGRACEPTGSARSSRAASTSTTASSTSCSRTASRPSLTLYHWDLPQALEDAGGWLDRDTAYRFAEYAGIVAERLGDRVHTWITINEAVVVSTFGYALGTHAPGKVAAVRLVPRDAPRAARPRARGAGGARGRARRAHRHHPQPLAGARRQPTAPRTSRAAAALDAIQNRMYMDPVLLGAYPDPEVVGVADRPLVRARRRPRDHQRADRRARHQLLQPHAREGARRGQPVPVRDRADRRLRDDRHGLAGRARRPARAAGGRARALRRRAAARDGHRERRRLPRRPGRGPGDRRRARRRPAARRVPARRTSPPSARRATRASTYAATSCGRSSTTSSGPRATPSASASSTSTTRRSAASRSCRTPGTARSSAVRRERRRVRAAAVAPGRARRADRPGPPRLHRGGGAGEPRHHAGVLHADPEPAAAAGRAGLAGRQGGGARLDHRRRVRSRRSSFNPLAGALSDRTTSRLGRRKPWVLYGSLAGALGILALSVQSTVARPRGRVVLLPGHDQRAPTPVSPRRSRTRCRCRSAASCRAGSGSRRRSASCSASRSCRSSCWTSTAGSSSPRCCSCCSCCRSC